MAVPAHDTRDHEFALKYNIPIHWVVTSDECSDDFEKPYAGEGVVINSSSSASGLNINGLHSKEAAVKVIEWVEKTRNGNRKVFFFCYIFYFMLFCFVTNHSLSNNEIHVDH